MPFIQRLSKFQCERYCRNGARGVEQAQHFRIDSGLENRWVALTSCCGTLCISKLNGSSVVRAVSLSTIHRAYLSVRPCYM